MMHKTEKQLMEEIIRLKEERSIYIIAHYYQRDAIQDIADFVGDSYSMAVAAQNSPYDTILVAGVDFMAESAAILCPEKTILSPELMATCPMANSISVQDVLDYKTKYPEGIIISYVNTPAEIKAVSDVCCTSSNALTILQQMPSDARILFIPDQNLAANVSSKLGRTVDVYDSRCPIHEKVTQDGIMKLKGEHPDAEVLVHPECSPAVVAVADYVGSTAGMVQYVSDSSEMSFIIATECGILHSIRKNNPEKQLIMASDDLICPNMKSITLDKILYSIENRETIIEVSDSIRVKASIALERMISYTTSNPA